MSGIQKGVIVYNNHPINFLAEMICLTDMWKAAGEPSGRAPSDWRDLTATQTFVDFLTDSGIAGISGNEIFRTIRGGKKPGTWAHWQIAFAYAKYLSPEFHVWVNQAAREKMLAISGLTADEIRRQSCKLSVTDHATLLRKAIALHGSIFVYNKRQGMDLTQARAKANAQVLEQMGVDLPKECGWQSQPLAVQEQALTATDIAKALNLPGNKPGEAGNNLLDAAGLYSWTRDTKGRKVWTPTEHGRKFGRYEDKPRAHTSGTVQPWGWYPSVLDVLRLHLATATEAPPFAKKPEPVS
ncbi:KilA-N domain-containing protein [Gluconobacter oxydans]|uniref:KilA-N domain-containing protein n=1 Tax=Gluconobacter oxydans NBRC 3293 TaxID=1315969 RepID=A0A829WMC7_GLUOY|nr:KilA-N domain-containing protein [Gluconobacter oxydans]GEM17968.1 hypothetical protein NBRC3293_2465 [Gluconobacter oxydans NBRC 3293]